MGFHDVLGQEQTGRMLQRALKHGRLAHAYLFTGPDNAGKRQMALVMAKALNCEQQTHDACDRCPNCKRIDHRNHPDVHWVEPEKKSLKIEQIRALQKRFSYQSVESGVKVLIIAEADTMTPQAMNSLLKFLEEPAGTVLAMLLVDRAHSLLPTIVSRCQRLHFRRVPPAQIAEQLMCEGTTEHQAALLSKMADTLKDAKEWGEAEWFREAQQIVVRLNEEVNSNPNRASIIIQESLLKSDVGRYHLEPFLDLMILWYQDMLNIKLGRRQSLTFKGQTDLLNEQVAKWTQPLLVQALEQLLLVKRELKQHVPPQLALEGWALSVWEG